MSKISTLTALQDALAAEMSWRRKELHDLKTIVLDNAKSRRRDMCIRAAVPLLYAHWEGFVKRTGTDYLEFVARQRIRHGRLPPNFLAMAMRAILHNATASTKVQLSIDAIDFFRSKMGDKSKITWQGAVNTRANLKSPVFREIVTSLGLDYSAFATREKLIDEMLLNTRNKIAHGQYLLVDVEQYKTLHGEVVAMMQDFYQQIDNAAFSGAYQIT